MSEHTGYRENNIVEYWGNYPGYRRERATIKKIDQINDQEAYILEIAPSFRKKVEIRAYSDEIMPVTVDAEILEKVGFTKETERNVFHLDGIITIRPQFTTHHQNGTSYDDKGFVVVEKTLEMPFTEEQLLNSSTSVVFVHMLQNYFQDKLGRVLAPDLFI